MQHEMQNPLNPKNRGYRGSDNYKKTVPITAQTLPKPYSQVLARQTKTGENKTIMRNTPILLLLLAAAATHAANTLAVLEIIPKAEIEDISITEVRHLTDELRKQAVQALPNKGYTVLTRDNMFALMPPDEAEAECLAESCAVEIGRAIGAEYISQGSLGKFGKEFSVSIELYETMSGKLLGSIVMESGDIKGLLTAIREQAKPLFERIIESKTIKIEDPTKPDNSQFSTLNSQLNQDSPKKSSTPTWIAISLDVLGAAALGFGIYQHVQKNKFYNNYKDFYNDYKEMPPYQPQKEYDTALKKVNDTQKKVNDAQNLRDIGFITGGVLLGSGIAVHIWVW